MAQRLAEKDEYEVVLVDIVKGVPQGEGPRYHAGRAGLRL